MPTITSGNTNSPVLMIAERAAELLALHALATGNS
jgi:choline dehydrogenase-like flavoprotein